MDRFSDKIILAGHRASARTSRETTVGGVSSFHLFHANRHPKMGACLWKY